MVRAGRKPAHVPLVSFDSLEGWQVECSQGAVADLFGSQKQRVWESPVARLVYRGTSPKSTIVLRRPRRFRSPTPATATTIWIYGNNWSWAPEPGTPRVTVSLLLLDKDNAAHTLDLAQVGWKEWWLVHKVLPRGVLGPKAAPAGGHSQSRAAPTRRTANSSSRTWPSSRRPPPRFPSSRGPNGASIPSRGQSPGANTGPGRLPFPTRAETILPENYAKDFTTEVQRAGDGWRLIYKDAQTQLAYELRPGKRFWEPVAVTLNGAQIARAMAEAGPKFIAEPTDWRLVRAELAGKEVKASWRGTVRRHCRSPSNPRCVSGRKAWSWTAPARAAWRPSFPTAGWRTSRPRSCCSCPT